MSQILGLLRVVQAAADLIRLRALGAQLVSLGVLPPPPVVLHHDALLPALRPELLPPLLVHHG